MKCVGKDGCGKELGKGKPIVMISYWCDTCKVEHIVDAQEMTDYIGKLHAEQNSGLPDIL